MTDAAYRILDAGERALVIEFGDIVDPAINARVLALDEAFTGARIAGLLASVPTYRSLMIHYDPLILSRENLVALAVDFAALGQQGAARKNLWTFPCCYDPEIAEDIVEASALLGLSPADMARLHSGTVYRVYMYGFAPGYCYLGGLPDALALSRRATPRAPCPENAVLIGGGLGLIATNPMPTGWYVIGRTPERMFAPKRMSPFLVNVGDSIAFSAVDRMVFAGLEARAAQGEIIAQRQGPT